MNEEISDLPEEEDALERPPTEGFIYEVWGTVEDGTGSTLSTPSGIEVMVRMGIMEPEEGPLYSIRASCFDEALAYHFEHNGWDTYRPLKSRRRS